MIKVYAVVLVIGILGLLLLILGGAFAENVGRPDRDPGERLGIRGKMAVGAMVGFGMGGMSAEFSPLDLSWQLAFGLAVVAAALSALWVRYSVGRAEG
jgi:ABC-type uncharacterized transport system permease subunit